MLVPHTPQQQKKPIRILYLIKIFVLIGPFLQYNYKYENCTKTFYDMHGLNVLEQSMLNLYHNN